MILRELITKFIRLFKAYQRSNAPDSASPINAVVGPFMNTVRGLVTDVKVKQEKIAQSELVVMYLEDLLREKTLDISVLCRIRDKFKADLLKAKEIRKDNAPGDYDGVLETCCNVIERTLYYYHLCDLKDSTEDSLASDPRLILEDCLLVYLLEVEIQRNMKHASKSFGSKFAELFSGWSGKEERLAEELLGQVQATLCKLDLACKGLPKQSLQYALIFEAHIAANLYEENEKCKIAGVENPLKPLLLQAQTLIQRLESYKAAKGEQALEVQKRMGDAEEGVRKFLSGQYEVKKQGEQQRRASQEALLRALAEKEAQARAEAEAKALAEAAQRIEDARAQAEIAKGGKVLIQRKSANPSGAGSAAVAVRPAAATPVAVSPAAVSPAAVSPAAVSPAAVSPAAVSPAATASPRSPSSPLASPAAGAEDSEASVEVATSPAAAATSPAAAATSPAAAAASPSAAATSAVVVPVKKAKAGRW